MTVKTVGHKTYEVEKNLLGHTWRVTLSGGLLANERKAEAAAEIFAQRSLKFLMAAQMIRTVFAGPIKKIKTGYNVGYQKNVIEWDHHARLLDELALATPEKMNGLRTQSQSINEFYLEHAEQIATRMMDKLTKSAPAEADSGMQRFMDSWSQTASGQNPSGISSGAGFILREIHQTFYKRENNIRTLIAKDAEADKEIDAIIMNRATSHIPKLIPQIAPPSTAQPNVSPVVRGDRPQTLLNVMLPEIAEQLARVTDPEARAIIEERIARIKKRVEIASAKTHQDPVVVDLMMTLDTLEETLESRLTDAEPSV